MTVLDIAGLEQNQHW